MFRILLPLAVVNVAGLTVAFVLGLAARGQAASLETAVFSHHFLAGLFAAVFALFVHSLAFTYMIGTGRWTRETSDVYGLGDELHARAVRLRWRMLPAVLASVLIVVATNAFGAAADPVAGGSAGAEPPTGVRVAHLATAIAALAVNLAGHVAELFVLRANSRLIDEAMAHVQRIRRDRGLEG